MSTESKKTTIKGGCHCGRVKYSCTAAPDLESGTIKATRCNCTFCQKLSSTNLRLDGPADFTLLSPASKDEVADYAPRVKTVHRYFCSACGAHVWMEGWYEVDGHTTNFFCVNLASVDQPQEGVELSEVKLGYYDMLHDNHNGGLADKPWQGGLV